MPKFIYKVKDDQGRVKTGTLDVANRKEAEQQLKAKGFTIQDLHPMPESKIGPGRVGQEPAPQRPVNASVVIPPLSLPNRSNPPSGKINSPAFLGRDPKAYEGPTLSLESKSSPAPPEPEEAWEPAAPPPLPPRPGGPPPAQAGGGWPPTVGAIASGPAPAMATPGPPRQPAPPPPAAPPPAPIEDDWSVSPDNIDPNRSGRFHAVPGSAPPDDPNRSGRYGSPPPADWPQSPAARPASPPGEWPPRPGANAPADWPPRPAAAPQAPEWPPRPGSSPPPPAEWPPRPGAQSPAPGPGDWPGKQAPQRPAGPPPGDWPGRPTAGEPPAPRPGAAPPTPEWPPRPAAAAPPALGEWPPRPSIAAPEPAAPSWPPVPGQQPGSDAPMPPRVEVERLPPPRQPVDPGVFAPRVGPASFSGSKIDLGAPPPKLDLETLPPALKLGEPARSAPPSWPPQPEPAAPAAPPTRLELNRPGRPSDPPATPQRPGQWFEENISDEESEDVQPLPTPSSFRQEPEEEVEEIDSWSKVLPPSAPAQKEAGAAPARRRRVEYGSYTDHLDDDDAYPRRRKKGLPVFGCFLFLVLLAAAAAGAAFYLYGHEIIDWLDVRGYGQYAPQWLREYLP